MKQSILFAALGLAAFGAAAQEVGHVISSVPVVQQVQVPRQYCNQPMPVAQPQTSGGGGLLGALIGAGIGAGIGHGGGQAAAIVAGTTLGAIVGNQAEADSQRYAQAMPVCTTETTIENRTIGYDVTYEYAGRQYTQRMPYDPGSTLNVQVSPVAQAPAGGQVVVAPPVQSGAVVVPTAPAQMVYQQPYAAYPAYPAYPAYYPYPVYRPYYPVGVSLGFVFSGHRHYRR
jgi:uncharacterized protein YcfJ